jgi:hypothetical protein
MAQAIDSLAKDAARATALERLRKEHALRRLVELIGGNPRGEHVSWAVNEISRLLAEEFPADRYECGVGPSDLESQLLAGVRERRPVILAFVEREDANDGLCAWKIHLAEIAGYGARLDDTLATIRTSGSGTWRARGGTMLGPREIGPFGRAVHRWSCVKGLWPDSTISLSFCGQAADGRGRPLTIHAPLE